MNLLISDDSGRMLIFASTRAVEWLAGCDFWCMDGNFQSAPKIFRQLYVVMGEGFASPCAFILMKAKTEAMYREAFLKLSELTATKPGWLSMDFEKAAIKYNVAKLLFFQLRDVIKNNHYSFSFMYQRSD